MIIRHAGTVPFTQIANQLLDDSRLSHKAKGILCYLLSKPEGWVARVSDIMQHGTEGEAAVRSALRELRRFHYARLDDLREGGRIKDRVLTISWAGDLNAPSPHGDFLNVENLNRENRQLSKSREGVRGEKTLSSAQARACELIWQEYPKRAGKPAALRAINRAIKRVGFDKLLALTKAFAKIRPDKADPYTPWPQRWFNDERYNDDPATWKRASDARDKPSLDGWGARDRKINKLNVRKAELTRMEQTADVRRQLEQIRIQLFEL